MQLTFSFPTLLASLLVALALVNDASAVPVKRTNGMVTLPIKRVTQRGDIHPQVLLQQHINRGSKRLARMKGRDAPSQHELRASIEKRFNRHGVTPLDKRYNRNGVKASKTGASSAKALHAFGGGNNAEERKQKGAQGQKNNGKAKGNATGTTAADAATESGAGISPVDVQLAQSGDVTKAGSPTADNSLGLDIEANDVGYLATVQIGTPPRDFTILMDSGSADFWVGSENCQSEGGGGCGNHVFLGTQSSSSFVDTKKQFQVQYGSGEVAGDIVTDDVSLAGLPLNKHTFGVATVESVDFSSNAVPFDGLMGLAKSALSEQGVPTPVESLSKAGSIPGTITSFKLGRVADGTNDGEVTFGGLDATKFNAATLTTFDNVNQDGFWEGAMDAVTVGGKSLGLKGRTAILDTGTTLIIAPTSDANAVHAAIPGAQSDGQGGFTIPCTTTTQVALSFGGKSFAIDPRDLLFAPVDPNDLTGDCVSGISSGQVGGAEEWLVGDVFLKNVYFSTDEDKNAISLANLA